VQAHINIRIKYSSLERYFLFNYILSESAGCNEQLHLTLLVLIAIACTPADGNKFIIAAMNLIARVQLVAKLLQGILKSKKNRPYWKKHLTSCMDAPL